MKKIILLIFITLLIFSCQTRQENGKLDKLNQTVEKLKERNEILKKKLDRQEKRNEELSKERKSLQKSLAIKDKIEKSHFLNDIPVTGIQILCKGNFHGDEIKNGADKLEWYGLIKQGETYLLKKIKIKVNSRHDVIIDNEGESTGKRVTTTDMAEPIILINGLSDVQEGEIPSVELKKKILYPGEQMSVKLNGEWTSISAYGTVSPGQSIRSYMLQISSTRDGHRTKQIFAGANGFDDSMISFIWAGDIDGDGALDLIMDLSNHYNVGRLTLFLSSKADEGQLIKRVAEFKTTGC
ncbi:MAG: hypothetical protein IH948_09810 [Bacteroidetes bacterium]|nr:hypothetical protein [Bacteroidota bacterium]